MNMKEEINLEEGPLTGCTTMIVGKDATADGSVIVAHCSDGVADERVIYVPAADHPGGSMRPVYYSNASLGWKGIYNSTPLRRYIGTSHGPGYDTKDYPPSKPLGHIPQVEHTYAYFDANYGIMNEHQLMIGECSCGAKVWPEPEKGKRIFYSTELSHVALERCTKASDAVKLIGQLIKKYGYYGTGETLLIGDPEDAWVMEMCGYDINGSDGIWVAQRVPGNGFFAAAMQFRIREVKPDSDDMMYSDNLFDVCEKLGWWNPDDGPLDWLPAVTYGECCHPYFSLRRVWRALTMVKPSLNLPAWVENGYTKAYPFSVIPDTKLSVADVAAIYRDHYEGTEFDMTRGLAAGPWHDPTRYGTMGVWMKEQKLNVKCQRGAWERPISDYHCGITWINQGRKSIIDKNGDKKKLPDPVGGISWIGFGPPAANCFMPFFAGIKHMPKSMETMILTEAEFEDGESAWWTFNFVQTYVTLKYSYMIKDIVKLQNKLEKEAYKKFHKISKDYAHNKDPRKPDITEHCKKHTKYVLTEWWKLAKQLIFKYNLGCIITEEGKMTNIEYPEWWLKEVGYFNGPISYQKKDKSG